MDSALEWWNWLSKHDISLTETQVRDWLGRFGYQYLLKDGEVDLTEEAETIIGNVSPLRAIKSEIAYLRDEVWEKPGDHHLDVS